MGAGLHEPEVTAFKRPVLQYSGSLLKKTTLRAGNPDPIYEVVLFTSFPEKKMTEHFL